MTDTGSSDPVSALRLLLDEMISVWICDALIDRGFDAVSVHRLGLLGSADDEITPSLRRLWHNRLDWLPEINA